MTARQQIEGPDADTHNVKSTTWYQLTVADLELRRTLMADRLYID